MKHVDKEISKYTKERELLNMNLQRREEDGSFLEATTDEQLVTQLNMRGKGTLMQLLKEGHYLHSTGQAKHRIEEDQWIELGAGTKVDEFLGMRHSSQTRLDVEDRLNQNMDQTMDHGPERNTRIYTKARFRYEPKNINACNWVSWKEAS